MSDRDRDERVSADIEELLDAERHRPAEPSERISSIQAAARASLGGSGDGGGEPPVSAGPGTLTHLRPVAMAALWFVLGALTGSAVTLVSTRDLDTRDGQASEAQDATLEPPTRAGDLPRSPDPGSLVATAGVGTSSAGAPAGSTMPSNPEPSDREPSSPEPSEREPSDREPSDPEPSDREPPNPDPSDREASEREASDREASNREASEREASEREPSSSGARMAGAAGSRPPSTDPTQSDGDTDRSLATERRLIETARSALARSDAALALRAIESHARRFPRGSLVEERDSLRVRALIVGGDLAGARVELHRFEARHPESLHRRALARALETAGTQP